MNFNMLMLALFIAAAVAVQNPSIAALNDNDINAMKYAITLENLEAAFYNQMQARFNASAFASAGLPASAYTIFGLIQAHENAHVLFINQTMMALGVPAPAPCTYNFNSIVTVQQYVAAAALFENTGVSAYDGAINTVFNASVVQALATIATIEARHASYLNGLNNSMPIFPAAQTTDTPLAPATVGAAIAPFLTCSYNVTATFPMVMQVVPVSPADPSTNTILTNDVNALNYALFLENLEAAFYIYGQDRFNATAFTAAGYDNSVRPNLALIQAHEVAHAKFLSDAITAAGATPVAPCTYNFNAVVTDVKSYIAVAALLETTGVSAYDGAVNTIYNSAYKQAAATIATVEARHSSYLNSLNSSQPIPAAAQAFDVAYSPATVVQAVSALGIVTSCPFNVAALPLPRVYQLSASSNTTTTGATTRATTGATTRATTGATIRSTTSTSAASAVPVATAVVFASAILATLF